MSTILSLLEYTDAQRAAVTTRGTDIAVTAGAGSGKTRALVGRYLHLLDEGCAPGNVVAITFTEKAAREMRTRIRTLIQEWLTDGPAAVDRQRWEEYYAALDAAPIGTIHSLCATLLRTHPAEAGIDPAFDVLDEGESAALRSQAVDAALAWAAGDPDAVHLFTLLDERPLRRTVTRLLEQRLDAQTAFAVTGDDPLAIWKAELRAELSRFLEDTEVRTAIADLTTLRADGTLAAAGDDTLAIRIRDFFKAWDTVSSAWDVGDLGTVLQHLPHTLDAIHLGAGRTSNWPDVTVPRDALRTFRERHSATIGGLFKNPNWTLDEQAAAALPRLRAVFDEANRIYEEARRQRRALDFDDLEAGAVKLLEDHTDVRLRWRRAIDAVLVDEFQDTNDRQRRIVYALTDFTPETEPAGSTDAGTLFVVGDAKQSIYRFRGADVTVFRDVQADITAAGGMHIDLDRTFRTHDPLLQQLNALLAPIMGTEDSNSAPYEVPFAPLHSERDTSDARTDTPYVEFCLGYGDTADEGRPAAAVALSHRLVRLREDEDIGWRDIALLFRASTGYSTYEDAFEAAGIPFVTVAGRGFYDRPEVRDVLNLLRAIADPTEDRALIGALRSPAFALTDGALLHLRHTEKGANTLWDALQGDLATLDERDRARAVRARTILADVHDMAGRTTVAQVLKHVLDRTHYRAILSALSNEQGGSGGHRARRNIDKLLADAHASRLVNIGEFLEYLQTLRDVAAREGEAPVEAGDAVQLMTVHKAKGLEFPVVVLADAGYRRPYRGPAMLLDEALGPVLKLRGDDDERSLIYRMARARERARDDAEANRLLYVAATRARDKIIVSGYTKVYKSGKLSLRGWLKQLGSVVGLDEKTLEPPLISPADIELNELGGHPIRCTISPVQPADRLVHAHTAPPRPASELPTSIDVPPPLTQPITVPKRSTRANGTETDATAHWPVLPSSAEPPARVVGTLVHAALRSWCFPDDPNFVGFIQQRARRAGLVELAQRETALQQVRRLLGRLQNHSLYAEIDAAQQRYHEIPFVNPATEQRTGRIDLLYKRNGRWHVVDFKTDALSQEDIHARMGDYRDQLHTYADAVQNLLGVTAECRLCFLNVDGKILIRSVS